MKRVDSVRARDERHSHMDRVRARDEQVQPHG